MKNMYLLTTIFCLALNAQTTLEPQYVNPTTIRSGAPPTDGPTIFVEGEPYVSGMKSGYTLPVRIPKATANFTPELSINYNSSFENGVMGVNWNISGLSQISRSHKILGFDGEIKKHNLSSGIFSLDSERLIYRGIKPQYGIEYTTLSETYIKIYRTIDGFITDDKNGIRRYYGYETNSVTDIEDENGSRINYTWYITKIVDREGGNVIKYEYDKDHQTGEVLISKILYNHNFTTNSFETQIEFSYMERFDKKTHFILGNKLQSTRLLKEINTYHFENSTPFSSYIFDYTFDQTPKVGSDVSRLVQINTKLRGEELIPIIITYPEKAPEFVYRPVNIHVDEGDQFAQTIFIDVDNDGYDDIITLHRNVSITNCWRNANRVEMRRHSFTVKLSRNNGNGTFGNPVDITPEFTSHLKTRGCERFPFINLQTGDFNGDGLIDILVHRTRVRNDKNYHLGIIYSNQGNGQFRMERELNLYNLRLNGNLQTTDRDLKNNEPYTTHVEIHVNDFDGDGISDIGIYRENWGTLMSSRNDVVFLSSEFSIRFFNDDFTSQAHTFPLNNRRLLIRTLGDFNGDGAQDIMFSEKSGYRSHIFSFVNKQRNLIHSSTLPNRIHAIYSGDFNGDGITDLLTIHNDRNNNNCDICEWRIRIFNELEFEPNQTIEVNGNSLSQELRKVMDGSTQLNGYRNPPYVFINDIDGDGRSDINLMLVVAYNDYTTDIRFVNLINKVTGWERTEHLFTLPFGSKTITYIEQSNRVFLGLIPRINNL